MAPERLGWGRAAAAREWDPAEPERGSAGPDRGSAEEEEERLQESTAGWRRRSSYCRRRLRLRPRLRRTSRRSRTPREGSRRIGQGGPVRPSRPRARARWPSLRLPHRPPPATRLRPRPGNRKRSGCERDGSGGPHRRRGAEADAPCDGRAFPGGRATVRSQDERSELRRRRRARKQRSGRGAFARRSRSLRSPSEIADENWDVDARRQGVQSGLWSTSRELLFRFDAAGSDPKHENVRSLRSVDLRHNGRVRTSLTTIAQSRPHRRQAEKEAAEKRLAVHDLQPGAEIERSGERRSAHLRINPLLRKRLTQASTAAEL